MFQMWKVECTHKKKNQDINMLACQNHGGRSLHNTPVREADDIDAVVTTTLFILNYLTFMLMGPNYMHSCMLERIDEHVIRTRAFRIHMNVNMPWQRYHLRIDL